MTGKTIDDIRKNGKVKIVRQYASQLPIGVIIRGFLKFLLASNGLMSEKYLPVKAFSNSFDGIRIGDTLVVIGVISIYAGIAMAEQHKYTLADNQVVTANEVAEKVGITVCAARLRLKRSADPEVIFAEPNKTTDHAATATVHTLSNGLKATVRELREMTGIRENTLRQRLKVSTDYEYVTRPLVFEDLDAKVYFFEDGSRTTVAEFAMARGCSSTAAHDLLESMSLESERARKQYRLDDGQLVTVAEVAKRTGVSERTAKRRVQSSTDPAYVLAPLGTRHPKKYILSDGTKVTAQEVADATGVTFEVAKLRLQKSNDRKTVFKPHYSKAKRFVTVTRFTETENGLHKVTEKARYGAVYG